MLNIYTELAKLDFEKLMDVYEESVLENGKLFFPKEEPSVQKRLAQENFYTYLRDVFFTSKDSFYAVWQEDSRYISALRIEPYQDGFLLSALETAPYCRGKGCGRALIKGVQTYLSNLGCGCIYSHISNKNRSSRYVHEACGFHKILDYASYIDGTVSRQASTYRYEYGKVPE